MNRTLRHRGPDDEGIYIDPTTCVGIAARRLSIIDVSGGHQPLGNEDGSIWAVLNGEIYNHPTLRNQLIRRGHTFRSLSDTEVLVHLYEEYGERLVHALEGMFAFAIWDSRRRRLLLARDRFGEKPLFYTWRDSRLSFASELTALRVAGVAQSCLSEEMIDAFFLLGYLPGPSSIVLGTVQLPPGHTLIWDHKSASVRVEAYWEPPAMPAEAKYRFDDLLAEAGDMVERSVRSRLISDVPLGVFLSGGVDSTLVAALSARHSPKPIQTFTIGYDVGSVNELKPARRAANLLGSCHHEVVLSEADVATRVPQILAGLDQPLADQALVASHAVAEEARRFVTVAVGGEGADELFGGYPRYRWLDRAAALQRLLPEPVIGAAHALFMRAPGRARQLQHVFQAGTMVGRHLDWVTNGRLSLRRSLYGKRLKDWEVKSGDRLSHRLILETGSDVGAVVNLDLRMWLPDDVLTKADRASMLVSLEVRTPFLDRSLAEFALSVPAAVHTSGGGKSLLRSVLNQVLPEAASVVARPKTAFRVPAARWLRRPLASVLEEQLEHGSIYSEEWFDRAAARRLYEEHLNRSVDRTDVLWTLLALGLWLDRFRGRAAA